uniref:Elastin-like isoform X3 n=1 Tax=Cicer arietinum TaxID=3827 RepID=A0A1S3EIR5_CICAR|nr:elastin-like isoform X4 [Cicer arietinum]XP_027186255.1 elastin-like isoform X3 [Cicer arietinum]
MRWGGRCGRTSFTASCGHSGSAGGLGVAPRCAGGLGVAPRCAGGLGVAPRCAGGLGVAPRCAGGLGVAPRCAGDSGISAATYTGPPKAGRAVPAVLGQYVRGESNPT